MRTKTLLIAAAALAVGVISSQASTTYSQNVVGYINQVIPAGGYTMVGSTLTVNNGDIVNNPVNSVLGTGLVSQPLDPPASYDNTVMYVYNGGYTEYWYFNAADAATWGSVTPGPGFFSEDGNAAPTQMTPGTAVFLYNPSASPITSTVTGNVLQGTYTLPSIQAGYNLIGLPVPIVDNVTASGYGLPLSGLTSQPLDPPANYDNDTMYVWNGGYTLYWYFNAADAATWGSNTPGPGFFSEDGNAAPAAAMNSGFFLFHTGSAVPWVSTFTVAP